jgi:type II secretory pathway pseudopilin PulG
MRTSTTRGAMLLEVLILAPVISALATVSLLSVQRASDDAEIAIVAGHIKSISAGLSLYALDHGQYPSGQLLNENADSKHAYSAYITPEIWLHSAPLGGRFLWQDAETDSQPSISIRQFTASSDVLQRLDKQIDDGSLESGRLQLTAGGTRLVYTLNAAQ